MKCSLETLKTSNTQPDNFPYPSNHLAIIAYTVLCPVCISNIYHQHIILKAPVFHHQLLIFLVRQLHVFVHCCETALCWPVKQTPPQHQKTRARCADRDAWPPPRPTRATATQPSSTGLTVSSRVRPPHLPRHPPHPTREGDPSPPPTPPCTRLSTPTPQQPHWPISWHTPS